MHLQHDLAFDIGSLNWDTFSRWEVRPDRRAGYLGDVDWDSNWEPIVSSDNEDSDKDKDNNEEEEECEEEADVKMPLPPRVSGEVYSQIYNGWVIRNDTDDMIHHVVYHYF
jgi:hypothetical protein